MADPADFIGRKAIHKMPDFSKVKKIGPGYFGKGFMQAGHDAMVEAFLKGATAHLQGLKTFKQQGTRTPRRALAGQTRSIRAAPQRGQFNINLSKEMTEIVQGFAKIQVVTLGKILGQAGEVGKRVAIAEATAAERTAATKGLPSKFVPHFAAGKSFGTKLQNNITVENRLTAGKVQWVALKAKKNTRKFWAQEYGLHGTEVSKE